MINDNALSPSDFATEMQRIADEFGGDEEVAHYEMDCLIERQLRSLGYTNAMTIFHNQKKWYA